MEKEKSKKKTDNNSKNNTAKIVPVIIAIVVVIIILVVLINRENSKEVVADVENANTDSVSYVEEIENGVKLNTSSKLNESKEVDGLKFSNIQLTTQSGMTTLLADVTNNTGASTELKNVTITLIDQEGNELTSIKGVVNAMQEGETTQLNIATTSDYINAYDFTVNFD